MYNKDPQWKIPNPPQFLISTLKEVDALRIQAEEKNKPNLKKEDEEQLHSVLSRLCEAMNAISNVTAHHGFEDVILYEENLTQIGHLLEVSITNNV
jgi:hypothetical protein